MKKTEQAAFPVQDDSLGIGLTKRELAAIAIAGNLASADRYLSKPNAPRIDYVFVAHEAIAIVDELFTQLGDTNNDTEK